MYWSVDRNMTNSPEQGPQRGLALRPLISLLVSPLQVEFLLRLKGSRRRHSKLLGFQQPALVLLP
jgi:hypothetical protein